VERSNPVLRLVQFKASETVRHAAGETGERGWKKRMLPGDPEDRA